MLEVGTQTPLKVAVIGDQGLGQDARTVLELIKQEGAHLVIHAGDFDYHDDPETWDDQIDQILGSDYPYFAAVGNHDIAKWPEYQNLLKSRLDHLPEAACSGDYGVNAWCTFGPLGFLLSGVGTLGDDHLEYARQVFSQSDAPYRICAWHKNRADLQTGAKGNEVDWDLYELCREHGAIIVSGHEHAYSRTKTLIDMKGQTVHPDWPDPNHVLVEPGATFAVVSGLGGHSIRSQIRCLPADYPYGCPHWANIYTTTQDPDADFGALFLEFSPENPQGYFKTVSGQIIDHFTLTTPLPFP
jgi:predicted phosphodiesterase